jgi:hypothetical protein
LPQISNLPVVHLIRLSYETRLASLMTETPDYNRPSAEQSYIQIPIKKVTPVVCVPSQLRQSHISPSSTGPARSMSHTLAFQIRNEASMVHSHVNQKTRGRRENSPSITSPDNKAMMIRSDISVDNCGTYLLSKFA